MPVLEKNVSEFLLSTSTLVGAVKQEDFASQLCQQIPEQQITSPIEQIFMIAVHAHCEVEGFPINPPFLGRGFVPDVLLRDLYVAEPMKIPKGIYVWPQVQCGNYRADFRLCQWGEGPPGTFPPIIVELDGHDFHDRDKAPRSYEKARDRYFVKSGYRLVHYTGSDVVNSPFRCAFEVLEMLGVFGGSGRTLADFQENDPFNRGD